MVDHECVRPPLPEGGYATGAEGTPGGQGGGTGHTREHGDGRLEIIVAKKQSGVPGVRYFCPRNEWRAQWRENSKYQTKVFKISAYQTPERTEEQAEAAALQAAIAFRKEKEASGTIKVRNKNGVAAEKKSGIKGVTWLKRGGWKVALQLRGKTLLGGTFRAATDSPEDVERARLLAVEARTALERKHFVIVKGK